MRKLQRIDLLGSSPLGLERAAASYTRTGFLRVREKVDVSAQVHLERAEELTVRTRRRVLS